MIIAINLDKYGRLEVGKSYICYVLREVTKAEYDAWCIEIYGHTDPNLEMRRKFAVYYEILTD